MTMRLLKHGSKIGNATVIVDIVPLGNPEIRPGRKMVARYLTDHDTGNKGRDANADMHNRYIHNMAKLHPRDTSHVSWHLTVDENFIYQHIPFDEIAWHCGDGTGAGNYSSVGVEKCMHINGDRNKIEANGIALHAYLMKHLNIPIQNVKPHQFWSGKYCPQLILNKYGSFTPFRSKIEAAFKGVVSVVVPKPSPTVNPATTGSIVDYLNALGKDSSFTARAKLAIQYGISGYTGTATQNTLLLDRMRSNWKPAAPKPDPIVKPAPKPQQPVKEEPKEEMEKLELAKWQREELRDIFKEVRTKKIFSSDEHEKTIMDGTMTMSYLLYLQSVIAGAALNDGKRIVK